MNSEEQKARYRLAKAGGRRPDALQAGLAGLWPD